ncbi:MAG: hypothetical protein R2742_10030 [Micropruina glycogenica]
MPGSASRCSRPTPEARRSHLLGLRWLVALTSPDPVTNWVVSSLSNPTKFALAASPYPSVPAHCWPTPG